MSRFADGPLEPPTRMRTESAATNTTIRPSSWTRPTPDKIYTELSSPAAPSPMHGVHSQNGASSFPTDGGAGEAFEPSPPTPHSSSSGSASTIKAEKTSVRATKRGHKRSLSDPYASIPISPKIAAPASSPPAPTPTRVSFANDPPVHHRPRRVPDPSSPPISPTSTSTPSSASPSTWPRSALKTPSKQPNPTRLPDTVATSLSPETPRSPPLGSIPLTDSPAIRQQRRARHHHSYEAGAFAAANSRPFPALPFTSPQPYRTPPSLQKQRKSSPGLLTTYELPANAVAPGRSSQAATSRTDRRSEPQSPLEGRRSSARASGKTRISTGGWETKVTEELLRLAKTNPAVRPVTPVSASDQEKRRLKQIQQSSSDQDEAVTRARRDSRSPVPVPPPLHARTEADASHDEYRPRRRSKLVVQHQKLATLFANPPPQPVLVHVVRQDSYDEHHSIDPYTIPLEIPSADIGMLSTLDADDLFAFQPGPGHERPKPRESDKEKSSSDSNHGDVGLAPRQRERKRSLRPKLRTASAEPGTDNANARSPRSASSPLSTSLPSMRRRTETPTSGSSNLRPSPSHPVLVRPSTPPAGPPVKYKLSESSPAGSHSSARQRLSSSVYEASLFFTPRAHPPEDYVPPSDVNSSPSLPTLAADSSALSSPPPLPALVPGQVRLVVQQDVRRESVAASLGKGKGKRLGEDDEDDVTPAPGAKGAYAASQTSRQRKESMMTSDDDVLGELPFNPRKRVKLSTSAALVRSLTAAAEAGQRQAEEGDAPRPELKSILTRTNKGTLSSLDELHGQITDPSRPESRRSGNVSFSIDEGSPPGSPSSSRGRSRSSSRMSVPKSSIPLMAIISPRPASATAPNWGGYHLREPKRYSSASQPTPASRRTSRVMSSMQSPSTSASEFVVLPHPPWHSKLPIQGWAFFAGFIFPVFWWIAAVSQIRVAQDAERGQLVAHTEEHVVSWRRRCRLMSIFSILVYVPVITLAIVFGR